MIRLPRLLDPLTLRERARLQPAALYLEQRLNRISRALMTLAPGAERARLGDLAEFYDGAGASAGLYRCCGTELDPATGGQRSNWEHALAFLADEAQTGLSAPGEMSAADALAGMLACQATQRFVSGGCDFQVACEYDLGPSSVLSALLAIGETLPGDWALRADFSGFPWTLRLERLSGTPECELRVSRNLGRLRLCTDTVDLVTRVIPVGRDGLMLPETYLEADSAAEWGVRTRVLTDGSIRRVSHLRAYALAALSRLSRPALSVTAEGSDLSALTGENLDHLRVGACCRLPLPDEGLTLIRPITALTWPDLARTPERVTVSLADRIAGISEQPR